MTFEVRWPDNPNPVPDGTIVHFNDPLGLIPGFEPGWYQVEHAGDTDNGGRVYSIRPVNPPESE